MTTELQVLFTPKNPDSTTYESLPNQTFFEYDGNLYFKVNDGYYLEFSDGEVSVEEPDNGYYLDSDDVVTPAQPGVGFTLIQKD